MSIRGKNKNDHNTSLLTVHFNLNEVFGKKQMKRGLPYEALAKYGMPGRIRTCDLRIRNPLLYPTELRAHINFQTLCPSSRSLP